MKTFTIIFALLLGTVNFLEAKEFVVSRTEDSGEGSLRQAILDANDHYGPDKIVFNIPMNDRGFLSSDVTGEPGDAFFIRLVSPLPKITEALIIDGKSQTRFTGDTNPATPEFMGAEVIIMHKKLIEPIDSEFPEGISLESHHQIEQQVIMVSNTEAIIAATILIQDIELKEWPKKSKKIVQAMGGKNPQR
ncbi:MAG: hypothetical protein OER04_11980 [Cyclobacteriaceae bacterium]|nr:hypothetical protein [Cyclobacteriaceae bacterium]